MTSAVSGIAGAVGGVAASIGGLRVTPEEMLKKASEVEAYVQRIEGRFQELDRIVNRTSGYWNGDAGDKYRRVYGDDRDERTRIINRLREHVTDLRAMAGVYSQTEKEVEAIAESLPADVIL